MKVAVEFTGEELALLYEAHGYEPAVWFGENETFRPIDDGIGVHSSDNHFSEIPTAHGLVAKLSGSVEWAVQHFRRNRAPLVRRFLSRHLDWLGNDPRFDVYDEYLAVDGTGLHSIEIELPSNFEVMEENNFVGNHGLIRLALLEDAMQLIIRDCLNDTKSFWDSAIRPSKHGTMPLGHRGRSINSSAMRINGHSLWAGAETSDESWSQIFGSLAPIWFWSLANEIFQLVERRLGSMVTDEMKRVIDIHRPHTKSARDYLHSESVVFRDSRIAGVKWALKRENEAQISRFGSRHPDNYETCARRILGVSQALFKTDQYKRSQVIGLCVWCYQAIDLLPGVQQSEELLCAPCRGRFSEGTAEYRARVDSKSPESELTEDDFREVFGGIDPIVTDD